jgi:hypothetical protein
VKALLLVLDNCEQVVDAAPTLATLLAAALRLQIIATSRESLRIAAERLYPVPPLAVPACNAPQMSNHFLDYSDQAAAPPLRVTSERSSTAVSDRLVATRAGLLCDTPFTQQLLVAVERTVLDSDILMPDAAVPGCTIRSNDELQLLLLQSSQSSLARHTPP